MIEREISPDMERRYVELSMRAEGDENHPVIEGDGAVFGVETVVARWFREKIRAGAFTRVLSENPDVIGAFNHDWTYVLGRTTAGTMKLEQTDKGLRYSIDVNPNDAQAMSVYEKVKRGDVNQSSFAFTVRKEEWTEPGDDSEELALREIVEIGKLFDVGPVPFAQYPEASAQARSKSEMFIQQRSQRSAQAASGDAEGLEARQKARRREVELVERSIYPLSR
jgi:HK97 family phage prohead protease